jgi:Uma2 family endonuclease
MSAAAKLDLVPEEDYLEAELSSQVKHEYLGGAVHAMAGGNNRHNHIAVSLVVALQTRLVGKKCRTFNSDTKIRILLPSHVRFYYPDASIICRPGPGRESFQSEPSVIFEVLSRTTRRLDEGEKKDAYLHLPTLEAYVLLEQDMPAAQVFRRTGQEFVREVYTDSGAVLRFPTLGIELPLAEIYEGLDYPLRLMEEDEEYSNLQVT